MTASSQAGTTPFPGGTPRRDVMRSIGVAGAALLGAAGLGGAAQAQRDGHPAGGTPRKKRKKCKCQLIGLASAESDPFSLGAGEGATKRAVCPDGYISISGGLQGDAEVTAPCMIRESHPEPDGSAWVVNVFCTEATNTDLRVGVVCFSRRSFELQGAAFASGKAITDRAADRR